MISAGIVAALVAAPGAMAGRAHHVGATTGAARDFFSSFQRPERTNGPVSDNTSFHRERSETIVNSADCSASVEASTTGAVQDVYIQAIQESYTALCTGGDPISDGTVREVIWDKVAYAFAESLASAEGSCTTTGEALGCFSASATAGKWTKTFAGAYAEAFASAVNGNQCGACPNGSPGTSTTSGEAVAGSSAEVFLELATDAVSKVEVAGCAEGDDEAYASAYSNCYVQTIAVMSAKAMATSLAEGECELATATVNAFAEVEARTDIIESCINNVLYNGAAFASTDGSRANGRITEH